MGKDVHGHIYDAATSAGLEVADIFEDDDGNGEHVFQVTFYDGEVGSFTTFRTRLHEQGLTAEKIDVHHVDVWEEE